MHSDFRAYPPHPWLRHWVLEPRGCGTAEREVNAGHFFRADATVGSVGPNVNNPPWTLQIPIPQNSAIHLLFNGFCGYFSRKQHRHSAEVLVPETGILWGRFDNIPAPVLLSDTPVQEVVGYQWIDDASTPALLAIREDRFCLVTRAPIFEDAVVLADSYLARDFGDALGEELEYRAGAVDLFEQLNHHDALSILSVECLMRALRPPEGNIPGIWSRSTGDDSPHVDVNELYPLALAWRHIDAETAEDLVLTVLRMQTSSGAIPVRFAPHETYSILEAPKPLLVKTVEEVWSVRRNDRFLKDTLLPLRRHVQWLLQHFDPKRRGLHCWQNSMEPLTPEIYESDLATVDLSVLLLTEIDALNRLSEAAGTPSDQLPLFGKERENLELNLKSQFWNEEHAQFTNAVLRGRITRVTGFPAFLPLLWKRMPMMVQNRVIDPIRESGNLPGGLSLLSWRKSALDDQSFPLLQQVLAFEILKHNDPNGSLVNGFSRLVMQGLLEWHAQSIDEAGTVSVDSLTAAFIVGLQEYQHRRSDRSGGLPSFISGLMRRTRTDWFDVAVVAASILAIVMVRAIYHQGRLPPSLIELEARMNSGYANKNSSETLTAGEAIIRHYPEEAVMARFLTANILMLEGRYEEAARRLVEVRRLYPDSPGPMIALGLACQLQGLFDEADRNYVEFSYLFEEIFPEIVEMIEKNRYLMREGFRAPPNWTEIYRYQLMHEL